MKSLAIKITYIIEVINMSEKRKTGCKFTIEQEEKIIQKYKDGESLAKIGKEFSCSPTTVKNILKEYNIQTRNFSEARRNYLSYTLNENIFESIDSQDKAYWLGVMYSDGYISKKKYTNSFGLSVSEKDLEWVEKFKTFLGYNGEIKIYKSTSLFSNGKNYARLLIGNNKIVSDLEKLGVVEHKTKIISCLPDIPFLDDFIRGYIDGDGSLLKRLPCFQISGNKDFLESIAKYFKLPYHLTPDKNIYSLRYNARESRYLEKRLYENANYYLKRKYDIASRSFNSPLTLEDVMEKSE